MDQKPVPGEAGWVKGSVKEAIGKLTGDAKAQIEGRAEKASGDAQRNAAGADDKISDATEHET